jgi:hypothetical protein
MKTEEPLSHVLDPAILRQLGAPWGVEDLGASHVESIDGALARRDGVLALDAARGVVCGQVSALARPGVTLVAVASPIIAEARVRAIAHVPVGAAAILDAPDGPTLDDLRQRVRRGEIRILYVAPAALMGNEGALPRATVALVTALSVTQLVIEDAHRVCPVSVEHDQVFARMTLFRPAFPWVFIRAFTDSGSPVVHANLAAALGLRDPQLVRSPRLRPNVILSVITRLRLGTRQVLALARAFPEASGLVICGAEEAPEALASRLALAGLRAATWPADSSTVEASDVLVARHGDRSLEAAWTARVPSYVVHAGPVASFERYRAEVALVATDGHPGAALLLEVPQRAEDVAKGRSLAAAEVVALRRYTEGRLCRHALLVEPDAPGPEHARCNSCDVCRPALRARLQAPETAVSGQARSAEEGRERRTRPPTSLWWLKERLAVAVSAPTLTEPSERLGEPMVALLRVGLSPEAIAGSLNCPFEQVVEQLLIAARQGRISVGWVGSHESRRVLSLRAALLGDSLFPAALRCITPADLPDWQVALWCEALLASGRTIEGSGDELGARCHALAGELRSHGPALERKLTLTLGQPQEEVSALAALGLQAIGGEAACEALLRHPLATSSQLVVAAVIRALADLVTDPELVDLRVEALDVIRSVEDDDWASSPVRELAARVTTWMTNC